MKQIKNTKGSVALISVLVISAILLILSIGMSESNISTSYQYLNKYSDQTAYHTAEACLEETIIRIKENPDFAGVTLNFDDATCTAAVSGDGTKDISINATYQNYTQNFNAQILVTENGQAINIDLLNWEKI